jgi:hypothetical protein
VKSTFNNESQVAGSDEQVTNDFGTMAIGNVFFYILEKLTSAGYSVLRYGVRTCCIEYVFELEAECRPVPKVLNISLHRQEVNGIVKNGDLRHSPRVPCFQPCIDLYWLLIHLKEGH